MNAQALDLLWNLEPRRPVRHHQWESPAAINHVDTKQLVNSSGSAIGSPVNAVKPAHGEP